MSDDIALELTDLTDKNVIRILDAVMITRDASGEVTAAEFDELDGLCPAAPGRRPIAPVYVTRADVAFPAADSAGELATCWKTPDTRHPSGAAGAATRSRTP